MKLLSLMFLAFAILLSSCATAAGERVRTIELTGQNTVIFNSEITGQSTDNLIYAIVGKRMLLDPNETLYLVLVSAGGYYEESLKLKAMVNTVPNLQIICKYCASAAGMLFATFTNNQRLVTNSSEMVMHEMYRDHMTAKDTFDSQDIADFRKSSDEFDDLIRNVMSMSRIAYEAKIQKKNVVS